MIFVCEVSWDKLANALKEMGKHVAATKIWNTCVYLAAKVGLVEIALVLVCFCPWTFFSHYTTK